ncbi:uncharacterized protein LOC127279442 [Leptopilina boulardi]|uniref:uncharacterized protein LOC127279442 n=1 Tax=Leptopilina boulardi TaxID=63433 RepID=UPI0021F515C7|nr:uncharacterized protein LOC127279442 [Leptopilina boulardi]
MNWCPGINFLFKTYDLTTRDKLQTEFSQHYFYPNICHVCNCHDNEVPLKKCGNCKMIYYCSQDHQRLHWPLHKEFCKHVTTLKRVSDEKNIETKMNLILSLENNMKKKLEPYENEMIEYQKFCDICHENDNNLQLIACSQCPHANFCQNHQNNDEHKEFCSLYTMCYLQDYYSIVFREMPIPRMMEFTPRDNTEIENCLPNSMQDYMDIYFKSQEKSKFYFPSMDVKVYVSQHFTRPLTLIYAMREIEIVNKLQSNEFIIHVLGASNREEKSFIEWEILFHWLPQQIMKIKVILVGPELTNDGPFSDGKVLDLCANCFSKGKSLELQTQNILYKNYCESENFVKPDILIGFNLGIIAYDSWEDSILKALKLKCPFIVTAFSERDAKDDQGLMQRKFNASATIVKNPFASLRPKRSVIGERVFYENQFLMIFIDVDVNCLLPVENQEKIVNNSDLQNFNKKIEIKNPID